MLRRTSIDLQSKRYQDRFMQFPYRRAKPRHLQPQWAIKKTPLAHKQPEEYKDTWDTRTGLEWHNRTRHRKEFRHWPWVRWGDDYLRQHKEMEDHGRTFSMKAKVRGGHKPLWNYYEEVGEHYGLPTNAEAVNMVDIMMKYVGKTWSRQELQQFFKLVSEGGWHTIEDIQQKGDALKAWNTRRHRVPTGFVEHVVLLSNDVCRQMGLAANRASLHEKGVLRTREMERYYAMPYFSGPAMPKALDRMPGLYPHGRYLTMMDSPFHPLQFPDKLGSANRYPA